MKKPTWGEPSPPPAVHVGGIIDLSSTPAHLCPGRIPKKPKFIVNIPPDNREMLERLMTPPTPEQLKVMKEMRDAIARDVEEKIRAANKAAEADVEHICRFFVDPPIKGEITRGKIRWRGLRLAYCIDPETGLHRFAGIIQHGYLIRADGSKTKIEY